MIRPNCRAQFTREDLAFLYGSGAEFMGSPDDLDELLDDSALLDSLLSDTRVLNVSARLYFYTLVRHVLRRAGIEDRDVADYVAAVLADFAPSDHPFRPARGDRACFPAMVDLLNVLQDADASSQFALRAHVGNLALWMTGVFPKHVHHRVAQRAAPPVSYYESIGRQSFLEASDHPLAYHYTLSGVFNRLGESFRETRLALNEMSDRLCFVEATPDI